MAYLQFDGVDNEANAHRKIGNLFDVKLRAIEELHAAGIDVILVVTVVNGVNNDQVGTIVEFAIENADKITVVSFQPVSFTGRDEDIDDETARAAALHAVATSRTTSRRRPASPSRCATGSRSRRWARSATSSTTCSASDADWGSMKCGCHPELRHRHGPLRQQEDEADGPAHASSSTSSGCSTTSGTSPTPRRAARVTRRRARRSRCSRTSSPTRRRRATTSPTLLKQFLSQTGARGKKIGEYESDAHEFEWRVLFVAGMWFQDLFNYDFRRTEMCIIPYGTQMGEISFCAYNTGVGWRQHHREDEGERDRRRVVQDARPPPGLRQGPGPPAAGVRARSPRGSRASRCGCASSASYCVSAAETLGLANIARVARKKSVSACLKMCLHLMPPASALTGTPGTRTRWPLGSRR